MPQDAQIKLLKAQRQFQQIQMQMSNLQRQYDQAVKEAKDLQTEMTNDCTAAAKQSNVGPQQVYLRPGFAHVCPQS